MDGDGSTGDRGGGLFRGDTYQIHRRKFGFRLRLETSFQGSRGGIVARVIGTGEEVFDDCSFTSLMEGFQRTANFAMTIPIFYRRDNSLI